MSSEIPLDLTKQMVQLVTKLSLRSALILGTDRYISQFATRPFPKILAKSTASIDCAKYMLSIYSRKVSGGCTQIYPASEGRGSSPDHHALEVCLSSPSIGFIFLLYVFSSFPYLTSVGSVLPATIAGNSVLLEPSPQTPLTAGH